ncbi:hypothetical protein PYCC9005_000449 [Savitreella phatthalungensis]
MEDRHRYEKIIPLRYKLLEAYGWVLSSPLVWFAALLGLAVILILLQPRGTAHPDATRRRKQEEKKWIPPWERLGGEGSRIAGDQRDKGPEAVVTEEDLAAVEADWRPLKNSDTRRGASAHLTDSPETSSPEYTPTPKGRARSRKVA